LYPANCLLFALAATADHSPDKNPLKLCIILLHEKGNNIAILPLKQRLNYFFLLKKQVRIPRSMFRNSFSKLKLTP